MVGYALWGFIERSAFKAYLYIRRNLVIEKRVDRQFTPVVLRPSLAVCLKPIRNVYTKCPFKTAFFSK